MTAPAPGGDDRNLMIFAVGPSQSGKNRALWELWTSRFPRVVSFDFQREVTRKYNPDAIEVFSYAELVDALRDCAGARRWHIAAVFSPESFRIEAARIAKLLNPPAAREHATSYAKAVGGIAIECGEVDYMARNGRAADEVLALWQRGRHNRLSLLVATQSPALAPPVIRAQSHVLLGFRTLQDTELDWWRRVTSRPVADLVAELPQYWSVFVHRDSQTVRVLDDKRAARRVLDFRGRELAPIANPAD